MDLGLVGKVVVVTGAASGMGQAVAPARNAAGARVTADGITSSGGQARAVGLDVTSRESWSELVADVGAVDALCNIAGPGARSGQLDTDDDEWRRQIDGHLTGVFLGCQAVLPTMTE